MKTNLEQAHEQFFKVTPRQMQIIREAAEGKNTKEIASTLGITVNTVEVQRHNILKRTGCRNMVQVVDSFWRSGAMA